MTGKLTLSHGENIGAKNDGKIEAFPWDIIIRAAPKNEIENSWQPQEYDTVCECGELAAPGAGARIASRHRDTTWVDYCRTRARA